jgi:hypothetical protein
VQVILNEQRRDDATSQRFKKSGDQNYPFFAVNLYLKTFGDQKYLFVVIKTHFSLFYHH